MFERKPSPSADIPPLVDLNPQISDIRRKRADIGAEIVALRAEDLDLARSSEPESADANREARVAAILGHRVVEVPVRRDARRVEIAGRIRDLNDAYAVLDREMSTEMNRASAILQERLKPEYVKRVRALADALIAVDAAVRSCHSLRRRVSDAGYSVGWMQGHDSVIMEPGSNGPVGILLHDIARDGYFKFKDIPEELK